MKLNKEFTQKYLEANIESHLARSQALMSSNSLSKVNYYLTQALLLCKSLSSSNSHKLPLMTRVLTALGHFHKLSSNMQESLRYYEEALSLSSSLPTSQLQVSLHLHLSSLLSQWQEHEEALRHGLKALALLKRTSTCTTESLESTVIAFYNIGVEYEFLKEFKDAEECYLKGFRFAQAHLGPSHKLTLQIKASIQDLIFRPKLNLTRIKESTTASDTSRRRSSSMSSRNTSFSVKIKRIDVEILRRIEERAAIMIQKVWRGFWTRLHFWEIMVKGRLEKAANDAKHAIERYEMEKGRVDRVKRKLQGTMQGQGVRQVRALVSVRKFKEIFE